ncbi:hypothetical protein Hanom_Chr05g00399311 [Helianthus anomalus]
MSNTYFTSSSTILLLISILGEISLFNVRFFFVGVMGFDLRLLYCAIRLLQSRWNAFDVCLICLSPIEVYSSLKDTVNDSCSPSVDTIPPLLFRRRYIVMVFGKVFKMYLIC